MSNYLMDIDGTICDDIPNEDSHRYPDAVPYENAARCLCKIVEMGHTMTYFTAREEKDRNTTLRWLAKHGFPEGVLIMNKPRGGRYVWVDNHGPRGVRFVGEVWSESMFETVLNARFEE